MSYSIHIHPSAAKDHDALPKNVSARCQKAILKLEQNPRSEGCQKLAGQEGYRLRVGDYRILYEVDDAQKQVYVYRIKHRKEVYR